MTTSREKKDWGLQFCILKKQATKQSLAPGCGTTFKSEFLYQVWKFFKELLEGSFN
jgi:hypothetical protein